MMRAHKRAEQKESVGLPGKVRLPHTSKINFKFLAQAKQYVREVKIELKRVSWPSRKETIASTSVVIILVLLVAIFFSLVDMVLSKLVGQVMR